MWTLKVPILRVDMEEAKERVLSTSRVDAELRSSTLFVSSLEQETGNGTLATEKLFCDFIIAIIS